MVSVFPKEPFNSKIEFSRISRIPRIKEGGDVELFYVIQNPCVFSKGFIIYN